MLKVVFSELRSIRDGGGGLLKSALDRLQLATLLCLIFYGGTRPGDVVRGRGWESHVHGFLWRDLTFF